MNINPMLMCDFYKTTHAQQFPEGTTKLVSYFTPRMSRLDGVDSVVVFGIQAFCKNYLNFYFTKNQGILTNSFYFIIIISVI